MGFRKREYATKTTAEAHERTSQNKKHTAPKAGNYSKYKRVTDTLRSARQLRYGPYDNLVYFYTCGESN